MRRHGNKLQTTLAVATAAAVCGVISVGEAAARDDAQARADRREELRRDDSHRMDLIPVPSGRITGQKIEFKPYVETEGGYDSNPDNLFDKDSSSFVKLESGLKLSSETKDQYYGLALKGRFIDYIDFDEGLRNRTDYKAALDTSFNLSKSETLKLGSYYLRDLISLAQANIVQSYADYTYQASDYRVRLQGKSHIENNIDDDVQGATQSFVDFSNTRASAFDYARSDAQINILAFTKSVVQPFVILDAGIINYYNQGAENLAGGIDRDANEQFAVAGTRLQFDKNFRIDLGYRFNHRDLDDSVVRRFNSNFVDVNVFWQPMQSVKITGIIERYLQEPNTSLGRAEDVRSFGVTLDWDIAPQWRFAGTGTYTLENALGDNIEYQKFVTTAALTYDANANTEVFLSALGKWVDEQVSNDSYDRYKLGLGLRLKY
jgi:hypothetical protein